MYVFLKATLISSWQLFIFKEIIYTLENNLPKAFRKCWQFGNRNVVSFVSIFAKQKNVVKLICTEIHRWTQIFCTRVLIQGP